MRIAGLGPVELLIILAIVLILFGGGRVSKIAGELGSGIRSFREGLKGDEATDSEPEAEKSKKEEE